MWVGKKYKTLHSYLQKTGVKNGLKILNITVLKLSISVITCRLKQQLSETCLSHLKLNSPRCRYSHISDSIVQFTLYKQKILFKLLRLWNIQLYTTYLWLPKTLITSNDYCSCYLRLVKTNALNMPAGPSEIY